MEQKFLLFVGLLIILSQADVTYYHLIDISSIGYEGLEDLKNQAPQQTWWIELGDTLLMHGTNVTREYLNSKGFNFVTDPVQNNYVSVTILKVRSPLSLIEGEILIRRHGIAIYKHNSPDETKIWYSRIREQEGETMVIPFQPNTRKYELQNMKKNQVVLVKKASNYIKYPKNVVKKVGDPIPDLIALVNANRWYSTVVSLAGYNRYTYGADIRRAESWIIGQIRAIGSDIPVSTQQFSVGGTSAYNIIAKITGTTRPNEWYVVGAHYDSTSQSPTVSAPGAEDNGSGSSGVLEMLRVFYNNPPPATVFFILYSGEEQGLVGSYAHVEELIDNGDRSKLKFALIMDMVGYTRTQNSLNVIVESYRDYDEELQLFVDCAADYVPQLGVYVSYNPFGSDHMPYLQNGFASVLAIESDWDTYPGYHRTTDQPSNLTPAIGRSIVQMNVAFLAKQMGMELESLSNNST